MGNDPSISAGAAAFPAACPFCEIASEKIWLGNEHALALPDVYPLSPGHTLVIPRLHVVGLFELSAEAQRSVWELVATVRARLLEKFHPDGFNIGLNDGQAAGQTLPHAHVHVIPRYQGDVPDPRGGVRWIIPKRAAYWRQE